MFVIPCKFNPDNPIIFECVESIRKYHPDHKIIVVDSNSDDLSYFDKLETEYPDIYLYEARNNHYATNGHYLGYKYFDPVFDFYYMIHDSLILKNRIDHVEDWPLTTVRYFNSPPTPMGWDASGDDLYDWAWPQVMNHMNFSIPPTYKGVFGPMFFCQRHVMEELEKLGLFEILPKDKYQMCAMERIVGIALQRLGYDPAEHSLQGEMVDFFGSYDETYVKKVHLTRW